MNIKENTEKLAEALLLPINPAAVVILGVYTFVWGAWLASPFWTVFSHAALYAALAHFPLATLWIMTPEVFWGTIAMVCGSVTIYGAYRRHYWPLIRGAVTSSIHWFIIATFYFFGDFASTGGITALTFSIYAAFVFLNIKVNHKDNKKSPYILHPRQ